MRGRRIGRIERKNLKRRIKVKRMVIMKGKGDWRDDMRELLRSKRKDERGWRENKSEMKNGW